MLKAEQLIEIMNQTLKLNLDPGTTPRDVAFKSLGIDSLDFFGVLTELENITGKNIADEDVDKLNTINSVVNYFGGQSS